MDPAKEIEALKSVIISLEADAKVLKAQLATVSTPDDKRIVAQQLHDVFEQLKVNKDQINIWVARLPEGNDPRPFMTRAWAPIQRDPLMTGGSVLFATTTTAWLVARYYAIARHHFVPYTEPQLIWRRWVFFVDTKSVPHAKRVAALSAFIVLLRTWTQKSPPPKWQ